MSEFGYISFTVLYNVVQVQYHSVITGVQKEVSFILAMFLNISDVSLNYLHYQK